MDDFTKMLEGIASKAKAAADLSKSSMKTVIVHPMVWKDEKEAAKASKDWKYREKSSVEKDLARALEGM